MMPHTSNDLATISLSFDRTFCAFSTQPTISCLLGGGSLKSGFDHDDAGVFSMTLDTCSTQHWKFPQALFLKTENADLFNQMREMTLEKLEEFEKRRKYGLEKSLKKKETKNRK